MRTNSVVIGTRLIRFVRTKSKVNGFVVARVLDALGDEEFRNFLWSVQHHGFNDLVFTRKGGYHSGDFYYCVEDGEFRHC